MKEIEFREWLVRNQVNEKVISDIISRVKRVELELQVDLDSEYKNNKYPELLFAFKNQGKNEVMSKHKTSLPVGKAQLASIKYAINKYSLFLEDGSA